jgi:hypothetical protein
MGIWALFGHHLYGQREYHTFYEVHLCVTVLFPFFPSSSPVISIIPDAKGPRHKTGPVDNVLLTQWDRDSRLSLEELNFLR